MQARSFKQTNKASRWRNLNYRKRRIYNSDIISNANIRTISICEGVIDALSAIQLGQEAIGLIGVSAELSEDQLANLRGKQVNLLLDWDPPGEKRSRSILKELQRFGIAATRKASPSATANDINDYLQEIYGKR